MALLSYALVVLGLAAGCVYLVIHGHPWFALGFLVVAGSLQVKASLCDKCGGKR